MELQLSRPHALVRPWTDTVGERFFSPKVIPSAQGHQLSPVHVCAGRGFMPFSGNK